MNFFSFNNREGRARKRSILGKKSILHAVSKRGKFVIGVLTLSLGLFFLERLFGRFSIIGAITLSALTGFFLYFALAEDMEDNFLPQVFILPFLFTFSFCLFYFLVPSRYLTRLIITSLYGIGLYSLFLSQNIFTVSSIRTIQLASSARIVSFICSVVSYFFLANIVFSLHSSIFVSSLYVFIFSFFLVFHSLWTYTLDKNWRMGALWAGVLSLCLFELSLVLWFWPSSPTIIALFLSGFYYTLVGLSHVWLDKRLFRSVLWEYVWVSAAVFIILISLTEWG